MRWSDMIDRNFLIVALAGAVLAHFAAELAQPGLPYWGTAPVIYGLVIVSYRVLIRRVAGQSESFAEVERPRERIVKMSLIEAAREARQLLSDESIFRRIPATEESPSILDNIPESIRSVLNQSERIERVAGDFTLARESLVVLSNRQLQVGRWASVGGEQSLQVNLATGEASLWFHDDDDDVEQESLPSVYHLIVLRTLEEVR